MISTSPHQRSPGILASAGINILESSGHWSPSGGSPNPLPGGRPLIKRRLFSGPVDSSKESESAQSYKRSDTTTDSEVKRKRKLENDFPPPPIDIEESTQVSCIRSRSYLRRLYFFYVCCAARFSVSFYLSVCVHSACSR